MTEGRITALDTIRGVAVMGIFSVNVIAFAMPAAAYFNPAVYGGTSGADLAIWALNFVFIDGKMRGLFTLLFGASTLLVIERAEAAGLPPASIHYRRMAWLLLFGLLHYYFIWFGDILTLYAIIGMVAFLFRRAPIPLLVLVGLGLLALDMVSMFGMSSAIAAAETAIRTNTNPGQSAEALQGLAAFLLPLGPVDLAKDLALHRGGYSGLLYAQFGDGLFGPLYQLLFVWSEVLGSVLLGMAALKTGFLTGAWSGRAYRWIAALGIAIGIAGYSALGWQIRASGFDPATIMRDFFALSAPFRLAMMFGYAALIILLSRRGGWLTQRIAAVGRAAFTNYLGTSLIASAVFLGWGAGLYGRLGRFEAWLVAPLVWIAMLTWSKPWLDRFRYGPFEWAWRSLARGAPQAMRRRESDSVAAGATEA